MVNVVEKTLSNLQQKSKIPMPFVEERPVWLKPSNISELYKGSFRMKKDNVFPNGMTEYY